MIKVVWMVMLLGVPVTNAMAQSDEPAGHLDIAGRPVTVSGFGDVVFSGGGQQPFRLGQVELDLGAVLNDRAAMTVALIYDEPSVTLGSFTIDLTFFEHGDRRGGAEQLIESVMLSAGQFDVPFGIDWRVYPSIERRLVSGPLVVEYTHGCWNDYGVQLNASGKRGSAVVFATNGFSCHADGGDDHTFGSDSDLALGGRAGLNLSHRLELGASMAYITSGASDQHIDLAGIDARGRLGPISGKGEFIVRQSWVDGLGTVDTRGFYVEGMVDIGKWFLVQRYGAVSVSPEQIEKSRYSSGFGYEVSDQVEVRTEVQVHSDGGIAGLGQVVAGF